MALAGDVKGKSFSGNTLMILSFHPCFVADDQVILADRKLSSGDRRLIQTADAIILPQTCSPILYRACAKSKAHVFPDYALRFRYPGKVGQNILFEKLKISHPATRRWASAKKFRDTLKAKGGLPHELPFLLKSNNCHEGEGIFPVTDAAGMEPALTSLENIDSKRFISQELIPHQGNVLRTVVLHKKMIAYWKRADRSHAAITAVSHGARVDKRWKPELIEKGQAQTQRICSKTGINLAAFDFVFNLSQPDPQPFILEINYYFGRRGLGGSIRYYRLLLKAIQEWLNEKGLNAGRVKLV